jgi:regulator of protease activity HflC (stomatin/prohibitin superfamily)
METYTKSPNKSIYIAVFIFVAVIVVAIMGSSMFKVVHPGERAVIF